MWITVPKFKFENGLQFHCAITFIFDLQVKKPFECEFLKFISKYCASGKHGCFFLYEPTYLTATQFKNWIYAIRVVRKIMHMFEHQEKKFFPIHVFTFRFDSFVLTVVNWNEIYESVSLCVRCPMLDVPGFSFSVFVIIRNMISMMSSEPLRKLNINLKHQQQCKLFGFVHVLVIIKVGFESLNSHSVSAFILLLYMCLAALLVLNIWLYNR